MVIAIRPAALRSVAMVFIGALIILLPALVNGYPFVYSDTGTYLRSAFTGYIPFDRPHWYGPFMRLTSFHGTTLWGVAFAQALLCSTYLLRVARSMIPSISTVSFLLICATLATTSSLGWYAGQLIPDIFTGIGLLAVHTLLINDRSSSFTRITDAAVITTCCWVHLSNLIILPIAGIALLVLHRRSTQLRLRAIQVASFTVVAWGGLLLAHRVVCDEAFISRSSHAFFMSRMIDLGMLKPYLDEHCATQHFNICAYKDSLPARGEEFLWSDRSPMQLQGGWMATHDEYSSIVRGSFSDPHYLWWHVRGSIRSTGEQLAAWEIAEALRSDWYRQESSAPYSAISTLLPESLPAFSASMQNGGRGELNMRWPDAIYRITLAASLLMILAALFSRQVTASLRSFAGYALISVISAAAVCATLSMVAPRYLGRDSWMIPFTALLVVIAHFQDRRASKA